jgi:hypothetical protein
MVVDLEGTSKTSAAASAPRDCSIRGCTSPSVTALHQPLCLDHFFAHSYATLENLEASHRGDPNASREPALTKARSLLHDCSLQALHVSLRSENLTNLDRGRLLDILLWTGELSETLRRSAKFSPLTRPANAKPTSQETRSSAANS